MLAGWYGANYSAAGQLVWGAGAGCGFVNEKCLTTDPNSGEAVLTSSLTATANGFRTLTADEGIGSVVSGADAERYWCTEMDATGCSVDGAAKDVPCGIRQHTVSDQQYHVHTRAFFTKGVDPHGTIA